MLRIMLRNIFLLFSIIFATGIAQADNVYQTPEQFLIESFTGSVPDTKTIWLTGTRKETVIRILDHRYHSLRIRYWKKNTRTAWVLGETGKKQLITTGVVVDAGKLTRLKILIFRESRGWEVHYPFFTDQFIGMNLQQTSEINRRIDGISGATLSVRAIKKLATLALYLDAEVKKASNVPPSR